MSTQEPETPNQPDPWKSFRGVMAGTLILEAIVVLLALPVVACSSPGDLLRRPSRNLCRRSSQRRILFSDCSVQLTGISCIAL